MELIFLKLVSIMNKTNLNGLKTNYRNNNRIKLLTLNFRAKATLNQIFLLEIKL